MSDPLADVDLTHEQAVVNDVRLHTVTAGPEDGDPVLLLHGFPEFWYSWRYQIPALVEAGYRVVAPDLRGYNTSEKPHGVGNYAIEELVGDVVGLAHRYGDGSVHVVGHDWGGAISWAVGVGRPDVIDRLVVMNAPHPAAFAANLTRAQLKRSWYVFFFQLPWLPERALTAGDGRVVEDLFADQAVAPDAFTDADLDRYRRAITRPGAATSAINYYRAYLRGVAVPMAKATLPGLRRFNDPPGSDEIPVPTLVLWGEQDEALGTELTEGLDRWVPDVRVERFADASHWVQCDVPERVNEELVAFL